MEIKFYQVGGCVRDSLLGVKSKDIDFTVEASSYDAMKQGIIERCGGNPDCIKVEKPEFATIRAVDPKLGGVDFVLARKDGQYSDGRRPDFVEMGTLLDDLSRRDFTVNAIARADDGSLVDPFNGQEDLRAGILRCVGDTEKRMKEDSLRMLRAIRFALTKDFSYDDSLFRFLSNDWNASLLDNLPVERIREELLKCFTHSTSRALHTFAVTFPAIGHHIFSRNLRLIPTIF